MLGLAEGDQTVDTLDKKAISDELEVFAHDVLQKFKCQADDFFCYTPKRSDKR